MKGATDIKNCPRCNPPYFTWQPQAPMGHSKSPAAGLSLGNVNWQGIRFWYRIDLVELFLQNSLDSNRSWQSSDERGSIEKFSWDPPNTLHTVNLFSRLTECASGEWGRGHDGCSWQVPTWRPESAASSPRSPRLWGPRCNRVSSYPRPAHRSSPDVWAGHYLDNQPHILL